MSARRDYVVVEMGGLKGVGGLSMGIGNWVDLTQPLSGLIHLNFWGNSIRGIT